MLKCIGLQYAFIFFLNFEYTGFPWPLISDDTGTFSLTQKQEDNTVLHKLSLQPDLEERKNQM